MRHLYKTLFLLLAFLGVAFSSQPLMAEGESVRKERRMIMEGNKLYGEKKYREAASKYEAALAANANSAVARYNLGLTYINLGSNPNDTTARAREMMQSGTQAMQNIASMGATNPSLASKACYNLGNVAFNSQDYGQAINYYKSSLRLNPDDDNARRNLRIAQLKKQQNQNQDKDQDKQDQDKQDQNKDQNQNQDNNQNQNQNQNKDKNDNRQQQQPQGGINPQTADQILKAMENKENQTRGRVGNAQKAKGARQRSNKNW